jgi:GTPase SAR1 family protein
VEYKNISFTVWDVGGQDKVRRGIVAPGRRRRRAAGGRSFPRSRGAITASTRFLSIQ